METTLHILFIIALGYLGAALGSFAGAQVWRIRALQLATDKLNKEKVNEKEFKRLQPLLNKKISSDRSIDLDTGKQLPWYDLIPIFSWLALGGKSRFSKKPIGKFELLIEIGLAAFFVISFILWPYGLGSPLEIAHFILWLASGVILAVLFSYDYKWYLLPGNYSLALIILGAMSFTTGAVLSPSVPESFMNLFYSMLILPGLYLALYLYSKGRWVGFGDVKLSVGLALFLANWQLSFLTLFLANLIGVLIILPGLISGKVSRGAIIPFGPLLIIGAIISYLIGGNIIETYLSLML